MWCRTLARSGWREPLPPRGARNLGLWPPAREREPKAEAPGSPALLHLALSGQIAPQALFISKLCISFAMPLLLSPFRLWAKFYAGACLLLLMYAMNTPVWHYPHAAFFALAYLAWAFWRLPSAAVGTRHCA